MSEIRYDSLHDTHVIIAPERLHRPDCHLEVREPIARDEHCPFCEGHEAMTPPEIFAIRKAGSLVNEEGWQTRVVPNRYKAVQIEVPHQHHFGLFEYWEGFGAHEVIIDSPKHYTSMTQWPVETFEMWLKTLRSRVADLRRDHRIEHIVLFKNEGKKAGSTQPHSHTQLIGLPIIPKEERDRYLRSFEYFKNNNKALQVSLIEHEEEDSKRIIAQEGEFTAYCPYASSYPFEVIISSKNSLGQIDTISDENIEMVAPLLLRVLKKLEQQLGCFDYNLSLDTPPLQEGNLSHDLLSHVNETYRFGIRIMPRIYQYGGFEARTGMMINPVAPELAAKLLRESLNV